MNFSSSLVRRTGLYTKALAQPTVALSCQHRLPNHQTSFSLGHQ
jgi:hypothetical protein